MNNTANPDRLTVHFNRLHPDAVLPTIGSLAAAGLDLYATTAAVIPPGATQLIPLGIASAFPPGYAALLWDRSGMGRKGIHRFAGVIDSDYRGEWGVILYNSTPEPFRVEPRQRVAQVLFQRVEAVEICEVSELPNSVRGDGAWGSTGQ